MEQPNAERRRKVVILGTAKSTKDLAPFGDETFEIWGLAWRNDIKRATRLFDLHSLQQRRRAPADYVDFLTEHKVPIYMQDVHPHIPNSYRYPIETVREALHLLDPNITEDYFASTIGYMLSLCICELNAGDEVHIYGIELADDEEWSYQRPNAEYFIGILRGKGIRVFIPSKSNLCKFSHRYGYEPWPGDGILSLGEMELQHKHFTNKVSTLETELLKYQGAHEFCGQLLNTMRKRSRGNKYITRDPEQMEKETTDGKGEES